MELVQQILSGDQDACVRLVHTYARMVGTVIWRATGDDRVIEDLSQEAFLRVFRALECFDCRGKLSTWIYTIANRVAIDHLRKSSHRRETSLDDASPSSLPERHLISESPDPEIVFSRKEIRGVVQKALTELPVAYRLALAYTAIEGLDYQTVASMMDLPVGTLKTYVFRGKKLLKEKVAHAMQGCTKTACD